MPGPMIRPPVKDKDGMTPGQRAEREKLLRGKSGGGDSSQTLRQSMGGSWGAQFGEKALKNTEAMVGQAQYDLDSYLGYVLFQWFHLLVTLVVIMPIHAGIFSYQNRGQENAGSEAFGKALNWFMAANHQFFPDTSGPAPKTEKTEDAKDKKEELSEDKTIARDLKNKRAARPEVDREEAQEDQENAPEAGNRSRRNSVRPVGQ